MLDATVMHRACSLMRVCMWSCRQTMQAGAAAAVALLRHPTHPCLLPPCCCLLQFERFCRPYYTAGFNAYELVEAAMVSRRAETVGECASWSKQCSSSSGAAAAVKQQQLSSSGMPARCSTP